MTEIKEKALQLGFSACGIIPAEPFAEYKKALDERVKSFPHSQMLYDQLYGLVTPPEGSKSIITCVAPYNHFKIPKSLENHVGKMYMFDGRLEYSEEYRAKAEFETYLKTLGLKILDGGLPDRWVSAKAGITKFGFNNFAYTEEHGSYIIVHAWSVDKVLEYDPIVKDTTAEGCSEDCLLCVDACPTKALCGSFSMDRGRCIPHISNDVHSKEAPDAETEKQMGVWLYGCDACQDVCPMNAGKMKETEEFPLLSEFEEYMKPENILKMDQETYANVLNPRFWYIGEDNMWLWKRNAARALANSQSQ